MKRDNAEKGRLGQRAAERFLLAKGHIIQARNFRIRSAEIDLITSDNGYTVFVEVKYRQGLQYGYPREAVGAQKQRRIKHCALAYINMRGLTDADYRFDVVEVLDLDGVMEINHIENAFW